MSECLSDLTKNQDRYNLSLCLLGHVWVCCFHDPSAIRDTFVCLRCCCGFDLWQFWLFGVLTVLNCYRYALYEQSEDSIGTQHLYISTRQMWFIKANAAAAGTWGIKEEEVNKWLHKWKLFFILILFNLWSINSVFHDVHFFLFFPLCLVAALLQLFD